MFVVVFPGLLFGQTTSESNCDFGEIELGFEVFDESTANDRFEDLERLAQQELGTSRPCLNLSEGEKSKEKPYLFSGSPYYGTARFQVIQQQCWVSDLELFLRNGATFCEDGCPVLEDELVLSKKSYFEAVSVSTGLQEPPVKESRLVTLPVMARRSWEETRLVAAGEARLGFCDGKEKCGDRQAVYRREGPYLSFLRPALLAFIQTYGRVPSGFNLNAYFMQWDQPSFSSNDFCDSNWDLLLADQSGATLYRYSYTWPASFKCLSCGQEVFWEGDTVSFGGPDDPLLMNPSVDPLGSLLFPPRLLSIEN